MNLAEIKELCANVAFKEKTVALDVAPRSLETLGELAYNRIYEGARAECELKYRIKKQAAKKAF